MLTARTSSAIIPNVIRNSTLKFDLVDQITPLYTKIEALNSFFVEQIFNLTFCFSFLVFFSSSLIIPNVIGNNTPIFDLKSQIMPLNAEIEAVNLFFFEQMFVMKKLLEEIH